MAELPTSRTQLPEKSFSEENQDTINEILYHVGQDFPESGVSDLLKGDDEELSREKMQWMWTHFMGRQHGTSEGYEEKIPLSTIHNTTYRPLADRLRYNDQYFTEAYPVNVNTHYTHSLILGGSTQEIVSRLQAGLGDDPRQGNVDASTLLVGQRLRWSNLPGERSMQEIYDTIAQYTGVDIERLREQSPWIREEERKVQDKNNEWSGPYSTEFEIGRLCVEAYFRNLIDWKNYGVTVTEDTDPQEQSYLFQGNYRSVPERSETVLTYNLLNGAKAHILNAKAVGRTAGIPRPTSDSQAREIASLGLIGQNSEKLNIAVSPPHIRAGVDVFVRLLQLRVNVVNAEIVTHPWLKDKELITALGEIPATHKADMRLRATLTDNDPDSPYLANL